MGQMTYIDFEYSDDTTIQKGLVQPICYVNVPPVAKQLDSGIWGSIFPRGFLFRDVSLLGPQSEAVGVHPLCHWLSATNMSISLN